jgi:N-formylglutamate deformylase
VSAALDAAHARFGHAFHINAHSMKPVGNAMNADHGQTRPDMVLSDREGETCDPDFIQTAAALLRDKGYAVAINHPYKGAELVARHSDPSGGRHSVQIELNRGLYLDGETFERAPGFAALRRDLDQFVGEIADFVRSGL